MSDSANLDRTGTMSTGRWRVTRAPLRRRELYPVLAALPLLAAGIALKLPVFQYDGQPTQGAANKWMMRHLGAYSDIASLYFRDSLWRRPAPYLDYRLEYPVGLGWVIWTLNAARGLVPYMALSAAVLSLSGALGVWMIARVRGANPWILALSPALAAYLLLNWDVLCVLPMVAAVADYERGRDRRGALWLSAAIWTKFFPLLFLPILVTHRILTKRHKDAAWSLAIVGGASLALNLPFAFQHDGAGWHVRENWAWFFEYSKSRSPELNFWAFFDDLHPSLEAVNTGSALLMIAGMSATLFLLFRALRRGDTGETASRYALLAVVAWFFFINKVYSPQYGVWIVVLLALCGAPRLLAATFCAIDAAYFLASFLLLGLQTQSRDAGDWFFHQALWPCMAVREAALLGVASWAAWRMASGTWGDSNQSPPRRGTTSPS